jgi:glycosyltransferase involved in cell wall biosynthesis
MSNARYLAVIPAYNESQTLRGVIRSIQSTAPEFDVLVVDDGSTDRSPRAPACR